MPELLTQEPKNLDYMRAMLAEKKRQERLRNKLVTYYPDEGPLRRELYPRHMEFFKAGADHTERAFVAGNRCLTPWSPVETDRGARLISEVIGETGFDVPSWDGSSRCTKRASAVYLRGIAPAFQIHLDNGEVFQCSGKHRVLQFGVSGEPHLSSWRTIDQIVRASSGLHLTRTSQGWTASYGMGDRLCDEPLPAGQETAWWLPPKPRSAPSNDRCGSPADEAASRSGRNHAYQESIRLPIRDGLNLLLDLCDKTLAPGASRFSLPNSWKARIAHQSGYGLDLPLEDLLDEVTRRLLAVPEVSTILLPLNSPLLFNDTTIVAVLPIGLQPIVDFGVEETENYIASGIVHHNCGKTIAGAYEMAIHLTGLYPHWWEGRRFDTAINAWAAGDTSQTTRDILQTELLGRLVKDPGAPSTQVVGMGTGMIPARCIKHWTNKSGNIANAIEQVWVNHTSGGVSVCGFKSYDQGREAFQGVSQSLVWADEEVDSDVWTEMLMRTMTTDGILYITFTPLYGITPLVQSFLPGGEEKKSASKILIQAGWNDSPHLSESAKAAMYEALPPHQRDARTKGIPQLGSGAIYPIEEERVLVDPFKIPTHWPRAYGLDVGWNRTAAIWGARDPESGTIYLYDEHYYAHTEPSDNARAIRARGVWIPGCIDPAARGRSQVDGRQLIGMYKDLGLDLVAANNAVEAGIYTVWTLFVSGGLKVFRNCSNFIRELRFYRRDEKGHVVKENDHVLDAGRYLVATGRNIMQTLPPPVIHDAEWLSRYGQTAGGWQA